MASSSSKPSTAASASTSKRSAAAASPKGTASTVPDPAECTICLDSVKIAGGLDACPHIFCFDCILQWSKVTNKCPVCNQNFKQIIEKNINPIQEEELDAKGRKKCKRKPKTVRVKNKEQRVSYEHTGTFGRMDEDSDDDSDYADMLPNAYDHMVNFMMQSVYHAMNRFDNDERIIAMPPFNPFERHGRIIVPRVQINANPVSVTFASSNFVDLTADSDEETVQLAPCFGQEVGDIDQTSASRRELRGHSLFDQASRGRSAPAVSTDSAVSRTRGARAVVAATSSSSGAQRRRAMSTVCIVPTAPPAPEVVNDANRRRRSSGLIELSDSDESDSSSDSASDENIEDAMSAIAAVRNQILGNMNQKTTASRTLPNLRRR